MATRLINDLATPVETTGMSTRAAVRREPRRVAGKSTNDVGDNKLRS